MVPSISADDVDGRVGVEVIVLLVLFRFYSHVFVNGGVALVVMNMGLEIDINSHLVEQFLVVCLILKTVLSTISIALQVVKSVGHHWNSPVN